MTISLLSRPQFAFTQVHVALSNSRNSHFTLSILGLSTQLIQVRKQGHVVLTSQHEAQRLWLLTPNIGRVTWVFLKFDM